MENSPWNIAADFLVDMSFSAGAIVGMLEDYERDHHTDMDIEQMSGLLYEYTSGYPFFVSRLCKLMDERIAIQDGATGFAWTKEGFLEAVRLLLAEPNTLFDSLYGDRSQKFYEDDGRRYFMLFLKPIINGTGNCYVEAETRKRERTDLIVDYGKEQFIVETKLWHGAARHLRGEEQLYHYLEHYHLKTDKKGNVKFF